MTDAATLNRTVEVGPLSIANDRPFVLIAGPCALESRAHALETSHALIELEGQADRVIVMNRGRKVAEGSLATLRTLAQLPVRMRLTVPDAGLAALEGELAGIFDQSATRLAGGVVEMICANDDKLDMVRRIARIGTPLDDIEIVQPSLDEMYAHFLRQEAAQ